MGSSARGRAHGDASLRIVIYHAVVVVPDSGSNNSIAIYIVGRLGVKSRPPRWSRVTVGFTRIKVE